MSIDNAKDANGVRVAGEASVDFNIAWPDMRGAAMLTCNSKRHPAVADADGMWTWQTNGLARGYYVFTHTVGGQTETAMFHLDSPFLWVYLEECGERLSIPEGWYRENVNETVPESDYAVSATLLSNAANGHPYWQNYVFGWNPEDMDASLLADIATSYDKDTRKLSVTVSLSGMNPPQNGRFGNLTLKYRLLASDAPAGMFEQIGASQVIPVFSEEGLVDDLARRRFYRPSAALDLE